MSTIDVRGNRVILSYLDDYVSYTWKNEKKSHAQVWNCKSPFLPSSVIPPSSLWQGIFFYTRIPVHKKHSKSVYSQDFVILRNFLDSRFLFLKNDFG